MSAGSAGKASTLLPSPSPPGQSCGEVGCRCQHRQPASPAGKTETAVLFAQQFPEPVPSLSPDFRLPAAGRCLGSGDAPLPVTLPNKTWFRRGRGRCRARRTGRPADHRLWSLDPVEHQQLGHMKVRNLVRQPAARREHLLASCPSAKRKERLRKRARHRQTARHAADGPERQFGAQSATGQPSRNYARNGGSSRVCHQSADHAL
jgi:hypothetical protein